MNMNAKAGDPVWEPDEDSLRHSRLAAYVDWLSETSRSEADSYDALWSWSVQDRGAFWDSIWAFAEIEGRERTGPAVSGAWFPEVRWFAGADLNWAERVLSAGDGDDIAVTAHSQTRGRIDLSRDQLRDEVARVRAGLERAGVGKGDRVFAYVPNIPEAVVALLATASLGAVWAACPPEFGLQSVLDRATQIDPTVLIAVDGYQYGSKVVDRSDTVQTIRESLPHLKTTVLIPYLDPSAATPAGVTAWADLRAQASAPAYDRVAFEHPLWILFSSGTTGLPKPLVHGHGGITLEHFKIAALMQDVRPGDRYFSFTTTAWMVWNRVVSVLMTGASIVLFDGDPAFPSLATLPQLLDSERVTHWGASATYLDMCRTAPADPFQGTELEALRSVVAAGSVCSAEVYGYVLGVVKPGIQFYEGSGGTDVCTGFVSGTPFTPVRVNEIPARMLGVAAEAFNDLGRPVIDEPGELVITQAMPSMPLYFWGDDDGSRYRGSYFERFPGVWHHGDRFILTARGTSRILGRSDATLNRGGVRLGTAEFYSVLNAMPEIADSLVVHLPDHNPAGHGELRLFVTVADGVTLDDDLRDLIKTRLREERSARHVPNRIDAVRAIPYTHSGKKLEVPVKRLLLGEPVEDVANPGSLRDQDSLTDFLALIDERTAHA